MNVESLEKEFVGRTYVKESSSGDKVIITLYLKSLIEIIFLYNFLDLQRL